MTEDKKSDKDGQLILIDKPKDYSSARIVNIIKKKLDVRKAGHSGTLDPKASGLMVVCTNRMTKYLNQLLNADKEYEGIMKLGETTRSYDSETEPGNKCSLENIDDLFIKEIAKLFIGEIDQIPPMYSAIKHKGKPLYKYARKNKEVERLSRKVTIKEFEIKDISLPEVSFRVLCSKGTYIRVLVNDFGEKLGTGAYLKDLRRTRIGEHDIKDSITLDKFLETVYEVN